ncbi:next to BRCA1 gene 1 protein [Arapaima gigas]
MELPVNLNFRGNMKSFLVSNWRKASWESMEATIKMLFGVDGFQVKYLDEDKEEVSSALICAVKQDHQLTMNVYKVKGATERPIKIKGKDMKTGVRPAPPYPSMVKTVDRETQAPNLEQDGVASKETKVNKGDENSPPSWFTSYMEKFKDQVVKEAVERICQEFSGQCCIHRLPHLASSAPAGVDTQVPEVSSTLPGAVTSTPTCSSCQAQVTGGGYQCRVCPSCTLCEKCSYAHDPSHSLLRARTPLSIPEYGVPGERYRFQKQGDRSVRKAEKQRLKAEKRQLKAEVKEIRKQLRMEKRGLQLSAASDRNSQPVLLIPRSTQSISFEAPKMTCRTVVPTMTALFLDENLPDGTRMQPGTKFIKYWKMRNTGTVCWTTETRLKFMWGNLPLAAQEKQKEVAVPFLQPSQEGMVSVTFVAPVMEGTYTSHWRLAHRGEQFGPRVWCSIVVDPDAREQPALPCCDTQSFVPSPVSPEREYFIPSVDLLTAQDLLSFELLDINIVQELEKVPHNTPVDMTPCMSPLPHDVTGLEKRNLSLVKEESEVLGKKSILGDSQEPSKQQTGLLVQEECEEDISGTQFVCETVIRSLTLEEAPDHKPLRWTLTGNIKVLLCIDVIVASELGIVVAEPSSQSEAEDEGERDEVRSQASSTSSEDYIIILPDCFDTSRPLGESMYSSAMSQPGSERENLRDVTGGSLGRSAPEGEPEDISFTPRDESDSEMLCVSQTLDAVPLMSVLMPAPAPQLSNATRLMSRLEGHFIQGFTVSLLCVNILGSSPAFSPVSTQNPASPSETTDSPDLRARGGIAGGLVKGALSVAASAYKALFTGQPGPSLPSADSTKQDATMMAVLLEMGFGDRQLNQRLLRKHNHNLLEVVNELVQMTDNEWYATRY